MNKSKELLDLLNVNEKSLSRIFNHMKEHATGTLTGFRFAEDCGKGEKFSKKQNQQRNKSLLAKLQAKRYGITTLKGTYIENFGTPEAREVGETIFFIVDLEDKGNLEKDLRALGLEFDQDSILFIPKGGEKSVLIGTNKCPNGFPGFGVRKDFNKRQFGEKGEFFTKVKNRPFTFTESIEEIPLPQGYFGRMGCDAIAKSPWDTIEL